MEHEVYIGSIVLEKNRWKPGKEPTYRVSEWLERFAAAGFDGIELWEPHALRAPVEELRRLQDGPLPIRVFNSYATFGPEEDPRREAAVRLADQLGASWVKFNVGEDPALFDVYVRRVVHWCRSLPARARALCECHPGTVVETPEQAARAWELWRETDVHAIIHPFNLQPAEVRTWFDALGSRIIHAHVQLNRDGRMQSLVPYRAYVQEIVHVMKEAGFAGSFTIEFTEGVGAEEEDRERLFASACADMELLRELL